MSWRSLRVRIAVVIMALSVVLGLGGTLRARADLTRIARSELEKRGLTIARDLAVQHADQIMVNDIYALYTLVNDFLLSNSDLRYIFILDAKDEVLVSSFPQGLPPGLRAANIPLSGKKYQVHRLPTTEGVIYDIAMPVAKGQAGVVRIGMLEAPLWSQVNGQTARLLALTAAVTLLGAVAGFALGTYLTRPLSELVRISQAIARGDLQRKAPVAGGYEAEQLARAFNNMTAALAESRNVLLRRNEELSTLNAVAAAVGQSLDMEEVVEAALSATLQLIGLPAGWVLLSEDGKGRPLVAARLGVPADLFDPQVDQPYEPCLCERALHTRRMAAVQRIDECPRLLRLARSDQRHACHISVPLRSGERVLGLMNLVSDDASVVSSQDDLRHLTAIGHHIGVAVENARLYRELRHKEALRGQLVRKLIAAQEDERRRIARELHDQYAQALTALSMGIEATQRALTAEQAPLRAQLEDVKALTARNLDQTYDLIFDLRPTTLDDLGLVPAVRWYAESRLIPLGTAVRIEAEKLRERLPPELETACYRVIQEALLNIAKHARAHAVVIRLAAENGRLRGSVEDDGIGFDTDAMEHRSADGRGLGLLGMQERVELLGGTVFIRSTPGRGTSVQMSFPIGDASQHE